MKPRKLSEKIVASNNWTTFVREKMRLANGKIGDYLIVERNPAIMIIPIIANEGCLQTFMVKQYRYPISKTVWQFPMGTLEKNKDPKKHAKDELSEEAGLIAEKVKLIGKFYVDPGLSRQICLVFLATNIKYGKQHLEETESDMKVKAFAIDKIKNNIARLNDVWVYSGILILEDYLKKSKTFSLDQPSVKSL